jgi:hypothetical protein
MNPSKKNKLYNKYLAGEISKAEMHELNQYALEDDFLFDAIEGTAGFEEGNKSAIKDLHARMEAKRKTKKRPLLIWFSAAAAVAILIVAINFINPLQNELAQQLVIQEESLPSETALEEDKIQVSDTEMSPSPKKIDESIKISPQTEVSTIPITKNQDKESEKPQLAVAPLAQSSNPKVEAEEISALPGKIEQDVAAADAVRELANSAGVGPPQEARDQVNGKVLGKEVGIEPKMESAPPISTVTMEDAVMKKEVNPSRNTIESRAESVTSFTPSQSAASPKRRKANTKDLASSIMIEPTFSPTVSIEDDDLNSKLFQQYLDEAIPTITNSGEFLAEFNITKEGKVEEFKVLKSIDLSMDGKLKGLIESFEGWKGLGNKKIKILFN